MDSRITLTGSVAVLEVSVVPFAGGGGHAVTVTIIDNRDRKAVVAKMGLSVTDKRLLASFLAAIPDPVED